MQESDPRFQIAAARRMLARAGCESAVAGHVSLRAADGQSFWTSAFDYFDETMPDGIVRASFDVQLVQGDRPVSPAVEFHVALYQARPDVACVVHLHSHYISVMASTGKPIGMYNVGSVVFHDEQAFIADDGTRPPVQGHRVVQALGPRGVLMIKNHGAIIVGPDLATTTVLAMMLETAARYHIEAVAVGGTELPTAEVIRGKGSYYRYFIPNMWSANYRRLRRSDPDLFALIEPD